MRRKKSRSIIEKQWEAEKSSHVWPVASFLVFVALGLVIGMALSPSFTHSPEISPMSPVLGGMAGFILWFIIWRVKRWRQKKAFYRKHGVY